MHPNTRLLEESNCYEILRKELKEEEERVMKTHFRTMAAASGVAALCKP